MVESDIPHADQPPDSFATVTESYYDFCFLINTIIPLLYQDHVLSEIVKRQAEAMIQDIGKTGENLQLLIQREFLKSENLPDAPEGGKRIVKLVEYRRIVNTAIIRFQEAMRAYHDRLN